MRAADGTVLASAQVPEGPDRRFVVFVREVPRDPASVRLVGPDRRAAVELELGDRPTR